MSSYALFSTHFILSSDYLSVISVPQGLSRARFRDLSASQYLTFAFSDRQATASDFVRRRASHLNRPFVTPADALSPPMRRVYAPRAIAAVLAAVRAETALVMVTAPTMLWGNGNRTENVRSSGNSSDTGNRSADSAIYGGSHDAEIVGDGRLVTEQYYSVDVRVFTVPEAKSKYPLPDAPQVWVKARSGINPFPCEGNSNNRRKQQAVPCFQANLPPLNPLIPQSFVVPPCERITTHNGTHDANTMSADSADSNASPAVTGTAAEPSGVSASSPQCGGAPLVVRNDSRALVWLRQDTGEVIPRAFVGVEIIFPMEIPVTDAKGKVWRVAMDSVAVKAMSMLWAAMVRVTYDVNCQL